WGKKTPDKTWLLSLLVAKLSPTDCSSCERLFLRVLKTFSNGRLFLFSCGLDKKIPMPKLSPTVGSSFGGSFSYVWLFLWTTLPVSSSLTGGSSCGQLFLWVLLWVGKRKIPMARLLSPTNGSPPTGKKNSYDTIDKLVRN
ncbi:12488_t:CDS:2, partial [Dentiscutata erythropus]